MHFRRITCSIQQSPTKVPWSPPLLRRCAFIFLEKLTEREPPLNSAQQSAQTSFVYPKPILQGKNNWHQVQVPTSLVLLVTSPPSASVQQHPVLLRSLKVSRSPRVLVLATPPSVLPRPVANNVFLKSAAQKKDVSDQSRRIRRFVNKKLGVMDGLLRRSGNWTRRK